MTYFYILLAFLSAIGLGISLKLVRICNNVQKIKWKPNTCSKDASTEIQEECEQQEQEWVKQLNR